MRDTTKTAGETMADRDFRTVRKQIFAKPITKKTVLFFCLFLPGVIFFVGCSKSSPNITPIAPVPLTVEKFVYFDASINNVYIVDSNGESKAIVGYVDSVRSVSNVSENNKFAYTSNTYNALYLENTDGTGNTRIVYGTGTCLSPSITRDGSRVAYKKYYGGNSDIYLIDTTTLQENNLTNTGTLDENFPIISGDASKIVYLIDKSIYSMNIDGSNQLKLWPLTGTDLAASACWSPDGSKIAFIYKESATDLFKLGIMNSNGTGAAPIYTLTWSSSAGGVRWLAGPNLIIFEDHSLVSGNFNPDIFGISPSGGSATNLTNYDGGSSGLYFDEYVYVFNI